MVINSWKLPTSKLLYYRQVTNNTTWPICSNAMKDIPHIFLHCRPAATLWQHLNITTPSSNYVEWLHSLCTPHTLISLTTNIAVPSFILTPIILWQIWLNRNNNTFDNTKHLIDLSPIITLVTQAAYLTKIPRKKHRSSKEAITWHKPQSPHYKLNIDGAYDPASHYGRTGVFFRDASGHWIYGFTKHIPCTNVLQAEFLALYHGLSISISRRIQHLVVETNS